MSDVRLERCPPVSAPASDPAPLPAQSDNKWVDETTVVPKWRELINGDDTFQVTFDMLDELINPLHNAFSIAKNMKRRVRYR